MSFFLYLFSYFIVIANIFFPIDRLEPSFTDSVIRFCFRDSVSGFRNPCFSAAPVADFTTYIFCPSTTHGMTMNMKQDRRLYNGLFMHVNNLIMNDLDTVKVTSKQTVFCSRQL